MNCVVCNNDISLNDKIIVKEMMYGTKEEFEYYLCNYCNALQIKTIPNNISKYYENYYTQKKGYTTISNLRRILWNIRSNLALSGFYPIIEFLSFNSILHWAKIAEINKNSRILDVGCGNGDVLFEFKKHGFKNLYGIDPNLADINLKDIKLHKNDIISYHTDEGFDLIMFNHSFEHIYEQHKTLDRALNLLNDTGSIMIRIPIINKAFETYKEDWVQIDAPRHFVIHSIKSIKLLCEKNRLEIYNYFFDSTAFQFLGSEQFKKGISSYANRSYKTSINGSIFSEKDIKNYEKKAKYYNQNGLGDQAAFFIRKKYDEK